VQRDCEALFQENMPRNLAISMACPEE